MAHPITGVKAFNYNKLNSELGTLGATQEEKQASEQLLRAYNDDFWQGGQGSMLPPPARQEASVLTGLLQKRFVFRNVLRETMERASGAFFGKSPNWGFSRGGKPVEVDGDPNKDGGSSGEEAEVQRALGEFWTRENVATEMAKAFESRLVVGRGGFRIFIPGKYRTTAEPVVKKPDLEGPAGGATPAPPPPAEVVKFDTMADAIAAIRLEAVEPARARLLDDEGELFSIVKYKKRMDWEHEKDVNVIEFSFVDNDGLTYVGLVVENEAKGDITDADLSSPMDLGGLTTFNEFSGAPYATQALYRNNQLLNLALTCAGFSLVDNGFGEAFFTNVDVETETVANPDGDGTIEVPKRMIRGGGAVQNLIGITQEDATTGAETRLTPGVVFKEPSPLDAYATGKDMAYTACLEETGQLHAKLSGDAVASGESRIQAMTDFWLRIRKYKPEIDEKGAWALTAVLRIAAALCGQAAKWSGVTMTYDSKIFIGPVGAAEQDVILRQYDDGIISRETAKVLLGVEDPDLEDILIKREQSGDAFHSPTSAYEKRLGVALQMEGTFDPAYVLRYLGINDEGEAKRIMQAVADQNAEAQRQLLDLNNPPTGENPPGPPANPTDPGAGGNEPPAPGQ